ncbi:hypothetical protein D3C85_1101020 [compost metagenome]
MWVGLYGFRGGDLSGEGGGEAEGWSSVGAFLFLLCTTTRNHSIESGKAFYSGDFLDQAITTIPDCSEKTFAVAGTLKLFL